MSFDHMVKLYEETRIFDTAAFNSALDYLVKKYPPGVFPKIFEPGIGSGRIAIPLAERGYQVIGVDISKDMLKYLKTKLETHKNTLTIHFHQADVTELPLTSKSFDIVIAVHLFYFIKGWKKAVNEILRILKENGNLILMHTGTGTEIPSLNNRYRELCEINGYRIEDIGVKSTQEVLNYLAELGLSIEIIRDRWIWYKKITLSKAIQYIKSRAYSFTQFTPDKIHFSVIEKITNEVQKEYGSLNNKIEVPNQVYLAIASFN